MVIKAIVHEAEEGGYWAEVPALPGCVTQGETMEEIERNLQEAVHGWLSIETTDSELSPNDRVVEVAL